MKPRKLKCLISRLGGPEYPKGSRATRTINKAMPKSHRLTKCRHGIGYGTRFDCSKCIQPAAMEPKHCNTVLCNCSECERKKLLQQEILAQEWAMRQHVAMTGRIRDTVGHETDALGKHVWRMHLQECGHGSHGISDCPEAKMFGYASLPVGH